MLDKKQHYLQIALNSTLGEAKNIIWQIPLDKRIIIEAGTPLIKEYGAKGIREIRGYWEQKIMGISTGNLRPAGVMPPWGQLLIKSLEALEAKKKQRQFKTAKQKKDIALTPYIVADLKCMDRGQREVAIAIEGGANAAVALGQAPIETLDAFIEECQKHNLDAMVDMMNVEFPLSILRKLKKLPQVVILHRGVDEEHFNREKEIPFHEIQRIKGSYDIMIAVAGGDTFDEARRAIFNDADIVVVWKSFYKSTAQTADLAKEFLKEIR